jgi:hypothetical protein
MGVSMAIESSEQAQLVRDIENLRLQLRNANNNIKTATEGNVRNALLQRINLQKKITEFGDGYAAAYGDGSGGTVAAEVAAEIAQANTYVDAVVGITGKTRAAVESEINPQ